MQLAERHRPQSLSGVVDQPTDRIESLVDGRETPNMLFYGPPGTGKTTAARALAYEIHGNPNNLHEINASDDRGINTIRDKINRLAHVTVGAQATLEMVSPIVLLDEADSMTDDAYQALRSPMEDTPAIFILTANDVDGIHPAIKSRCHMFEFDYPSTSAIRARLSDIADAEGYTDISEERLRDIADKSNGDLRTALNLLEQEIQFNAKRTSERAERVKEFIENMESGE